MTATTAEDAPLRPTGAMERFNIIRNHLNFYNNIQVSATYSLPSSFVSTHGLLPIIFSALTENLKMQPILNVKIEDSGVREPKWMCLPTIDLGKTVKVIEQDISKSHDNWITTGHLQRTDRDPTLPLWRIIVAVPPSSAQKPESETTSFALAFYCHHGIADGLSAGAFHLTFLSALNKLISNPSFISPDSVVSTPKIPLVPSLEQKTNLPVSVWYATKMIFAAFVYSPSSPLTWSGPPIQKEPPTVPPTSSLISFSIPSSDVQKLVTKCREQKTTLTCLVSVLAARHLATIHPSHKRFTGSIPFSFRKFTGHAPLDMGCYTSLCAPQYSSETTTPAGYISCLSSSNPLVKKQDEELLWDSARKCRQVIEENTKEIRNQAVNMLKFVPDLRGFFLGKLGGKREHAYEVTNIGVLDGGLGAGKEGGKGKATFSKATFSKATFSTALCTYGDPHCVSMVTVRGGDMTVGINWIEAVTPGEEARGLKDFLEGQLREMAENFVPGRNVYVSGREESHSAGSGMRVWIGAGLVVVAAGVWMSL
ncbi:uncharacterized protein PAC_19245 [Phialocephala subalpina]|uniref:Alcohol acetyltransferase n=1 Tax=Phialocephala subalpina TaxID=576137 RepID=A0A1L7XWJ9_9HELO|nr:uncharacterized protein PAC_19245 [Phialocephala subalpina]